MHPMLPGIAAALCAVAACRVDRHAVEAPPAYQEEVTYEYLDLPAGETIVDFEVFYEELDPYGDWVDLDGYGRGFRPSRAGFRPYFVGYWSYTAYGFMWMSDEPFAWAVYHYGRWCQRDDAWYWIPDTNWGPAWVSWRETDDWISWSPLPPGDDWSPPDDDWWTSVPWEHLTDPDLPDHYDTPPRTGWSRPRMIQHFGRNPSGSHWVLGPTRDRAAARGVTLRPNPLPPDSGRFDPPRHRALVQHATDQRARRNPEHPPRPARPLPAHPTPVTAN